MADRLETLFSGGELAPRPARTGLVTAALAVAIPLDLLGVLSCTSVPGAGLTLMAWWLIDQELGLMEGGLVHSDAAPKLANQKRLAHAALVFCGINLFAQILLLSTGIYEQWLLTLSHLWPL